MSQIRGRQKFSKYKKLIMVLSYFYRLFSVAIRVKLLGFHRDTKGLKGIVIRYALLKSIAKKCGDNVLIQPGTYIMVPQNLCLGDNVSIHPMCYIDSTGGITIGNDVSIAHGTTIMSTSHKYDKVDVPIKDQGITCGSVVIEDDVWIGAKAVILAGIKISSGCVIGASAVVTRNTEKGGIYVGIPARLIRKRVYEHESFICT